MRPGWDDYFFEIMESVSKRATCDRGKSGCVIVKNNHILTTGYVGSPPGFESCDDSGHKFQGRFSADQFNPEMFDFNNHDGINLKRNQFSIHCIRTVHGEQNAILQAAKIGVSLEGSTLYCRMTPCYTCAMMIISVGIIRVCCERQYQKAEESEKMFEKAGIELIYKYPGEVQKYSQTQVKDKM